jgi:hypothetical protein
MEQQQEWRCGRTQKARQCQNSSGQREEKQAGEEEAEQLDEEAEQLEEETEQLDEEAEQLEEEEAEHLEEETEQLEDGGMESDGEENLPEQCFYASFKIYLGPCESAEMTSHGVWSNGTEGEFFV